MTTDRLALPRRYRDQLEALLRQHVPGVEVWAYGSRVNSESHEGSDLDLALRGPGLKPLGGGLYDLLEAIEKSNIPILVQAHDWAKLPESFHRGIERDYVVVQEGAKQTTAGEWPVVTISDIAEKVAMGPFGSSIKVETFVPEGVPVISGQHLHGFRVDDTPGFNFISHEHAQRLANANVMRGDIVLTHRGTIGQVACIPEHSQFDRYVVSQSQFYMRCDRSKAIPEFVTMYFKSHEGQHQLLANASQVGVPSIAQPVTYLRTIEIPLPPMPQQRAIAHVLGTLDDKIELNRRMNETLEAMARALFKSWFVDFEPVRAKREGRWRPGESLPGLAADLYELFPDRLVDSVLGEIPEGWEVRALGTLLDDVIGGDWGKETPDVDHTEPVSIIRGTDLPALAEGGSGSVPLRFTTKKKAERRMLKDGDIIIEVSGGSPTQSTGRSLMMTRDVLRRFPGTVVCASFCRRFRPNSWRDGLLVSRHLDFLHSTGKMWDYQLQSTGIANFQTTRFLKEEMAIWPGEPLLTTFAEIVGPIVRQTSRNENMILAAQRETLIPKLVSGELRVAIG